MTKKPADTSFLKSQLAGSAFFARKGQLEPEDGSNHEEEIDRSITNDSVDAIANDAMNNFISDVTNEVVIDFNTDFITSALPDSELRRWREILDDTQTQNSSLRLTNNEKFVVENLIQELRRKYRIKTSMNELVRLGLLLVVHDYKKTKTKSIIYKIKKP